MKNTIIPFLLLIALTCYNCKEIPQPLTTERDQIKIALDSLGNEFIKDSLLSSVSIGIYNNGKKITAHYGELDKGLNNKPSDETIYEIASVSKTFTGMLVAKAVLDGKLTIEDNIQDHLGSEYSNLEFEGKPILIKHLLFHQAGLPKYLPKSIEDLVQNNVPDLPMKIVEIEKYYSKEAFLEDIKKTTISAVPGSTYAYSNVDVELMAHILETIYDMTYEELVIKYISNPSKMANTKVHLSKEEKMFLANGYGIDRTTVPHLSNIPSGAAGGLKFTSPDLTNYMELLLDSTNSLSVESTKILLDVENEDYGAGYFWPIILNTPDGNVYRHHGGAFGTQNLFYIYPKYNIGISVITNQSDRETANKLDHLVSGILVQLKQESLDKSKK